MVDASVPNRTFEPKRKEVRGIDRCIRFHTEETFTRETSANRLHYLSSGFPRSRE